MPGIISIFPHRVNKFRRILRIRLKTPTVGVVGEFGRLETNHRNPAIGHPIASTAVVILGDPKLKVSPEGPSG
jgi:hypothetical protein